MKSVNKFDIIVWSNIVILSLTTNPVIGFFAAIVGGIAVYLSYVTDRE
jgi:hypothetical protein